MVVYLAVGFCALATVMFLCSRPFTGALSCGAALGAGMGWLLHRVISGAESNVKLTLEQREQFDQLTSEARTIFILLCVGALVVLIVLAWIEGKFSRK